MSDLAAEPEGLASLPMYDRPETRDATDRFWAAIRDRLVQRDIPAPAALTRSGDIWADWGSPEMVFSQSCSLPYRARLQCKVRIVAAPHFNIDCPPGQTFSVIVGCGGSVPPAPRLAINDGLSQSGWAAAYGWMRSHQISPREVIESGSHVASAYAVLERRADFAAIDAQSLLLMQRHDPATRALVEIDRTAPTPIQPYVTGHSFDPAIVGTAVKEAFGRLSDADRKALNICGVVDVDPPAYLQPATPPAPTDVRLGYPVN